jgi:hypothetical protein
MYRNLSYTILVSLIFCSILNAGEPFAPKVEVPKNPNNDNDLTLAIAFLNDVIIPDKEEVGVPAYPEAKIFQTTKAQAGMLPTVRLLSEDAIKDVVAFYKEKLKDWKFKDYYGTQTFFKDDVQKAMFGQEPVIQIESADNFKKTMPSAHAVITIGYIPKKEEKPAN